MTVENTEKKMYVLLECYRKINGRESNVFVGNLYIYEDKCVIKLFLIFTVCGFNVDVNVNHFEMEKSLFDLYVVSCCRNKICFCLMPQQTRESNSLERVIPTDPLMSALHLFICMIMKCSE